MGMVAARKIPTLRGFPPHRRHCTADLAKPLGEARSRPVTQKAPPNGERGGAPA